MLRIEGVEQLFAEPRMAFTVRGNRRSEQVINELQNGGSADSGKYFVIFEDADVLAGYNGVLPEQTVAVFDEPYGSGHFSMYTASRERDRTRMPKWTQHAQWAVGVTPVCNPRGCAQQIAADFFRHASEYMRKGWFPWGPPRKRDSAPVRIILPDGMDDLIKRLNSGPDLVQAIAKAQYAVELPEGSKISWVRVAGQPIGCDLSRLTQILMSLQEFEEISQLLVEVNPDISRLLLSGVELSSDSTLGRLYLYPPQRSFSVDRADLHYTGRGLFASEIDEMPGGFGELAHLDYSYGVNQERWRECFRFLTAEGPLLFLVSDRWSECYIEEMQWLAGHMRSQGYDARTATAAELDELTIGDTVQFRAEPVATIWRQFPIFETSGKLAELVAAAHDGAVRMIPEFAHFGNKVWFSLFRQFEDFFRNHLSAYAYGILSELLPDSHLVMNGTEFPCVVADSEIGSIAHLRRLDRAIRDQIVLKVCGANHLTARSYGVLMGHGLKQNQWQNWIDKRLEQRQPFIIQRRVPTAVAHLPVKNTKTGYPELFSCRVLIRPWVVGGKLVSASCVAVPSSTMRVHGRVDMAVAPVVFDD